MAWRMVGMTALLVACGGSDGAGSPPADGAPDAASGDAALPPHYLEVAVLGEVPGSVSSTDGAIAARRPARRSCPTAPASS